MGVLKGPKLEALTPLHDWVVVRLDRPRERESVDSLIVAPEVTQELPWWGEVLAVGPGRHSSKTGVLIPMSVRVGERVYCDKYKGQEVEIDGCMIRIIPDAEILGVLE